MNGSDVSNRPGGGRFTGWQITTMVVAVVFVVVALPMTVLAATGSLVNITDPVQASYMARVNAKGGLAVTPRDAATGYQAKVSSSGRLLTDVTGSAAYAAPSTAFSVVVSGDQTLQTQIPSFTSGKLMITSLTFVQTNGSPSYAWIYKYSDGACSVLSGYYAYLAAQDSTTVNATFPTPIIVTQPCALVHVGGYGLLTITGYRVP